MYFVYTIKNSNNIYYKGFTTDPVQRLEYHNKGLSQYTKNNGPWELIFIQKFKTKEEALTFEKLLKRLNHKYLDLLIQSERNEI
ncbi:GIY-YIG nuclease family protein [Crocinitomix catalasitica]|uniref:GIY-YIG nuclease family protein n=1 Tax=Crocinitomix catalasitica TaxID=184607 RepID=UPI000481371E|nr:GIY-YIG nuclease family protein [Crocinitomix catalasitica]